MVARRKRSWKSLVSVIAGLLVAAITTGQKYSINDGQLSVFDFWEPLTAGLFTFLTFAQSAALAFDQSQELRRETKCRKPGNFADSRAPLAPIQNIFWLASSMGATHLRPMYIVTSLVLLCGNTLVLKEAIPWVRMKRSEGYRALSPSLLISIFTFICCSGIVLIGMLICFLANITPCCRGELVYFHPHVTLIATLCSTIFVIWGLGGQLLKLVQSGSAVGVSLSVHRPSITRGIVGLFAAWELAKANYFQGLGSLATTGLAVAIEGSILCYAHFCRQSERSIPQEK